jgi:hypothetical protein
MADYQTWERKRSPQGGLMMPQAPSLAESFGSTGDFITTLPQSAEENGASVDQPLAAEKVALLQNRYRAFTWDSLSAGTGLPDSYSGTRDGLTGPAIDKAELDAVLAFDTGAYSREQFVFELKKLNDWREILKRKAGQ